MTTLSGPSRYIFILVGLILILQGPVATAQSKMKGVTVSYEQNGTSRFARFNNSNPYPVRVEFSYQGTRTRGSAEVSGQGAVLVAAEFSATYGVTGLSIKSVQIKLVMHGD